MLLSNSENKPKLTLLLKQAWSCFITNRSTSSNAGSVGPRRSITVAFRVIRLTSCVPTVLTVDKSQALGKDVEGVGHYRPDEVPEKKQLESGNSR